MRKACATGIVGEKGLTADGARAMIRAHFLSRAVGGGHVFPLGRRAPAGRQLDRGGSGGEEEDADLP